MAAQAMLHIWQSYPLIYRRTYIWLLCLPKQWPWKVLASNNSCWQYHVIKAKILMFHLTQIKVLRGLQISHKFFRRLFLCSAPSPQHLVLLKFLVVGPSHQPVFSQCLFLFNVWSPFIVLWQWHLWVHSDQGLPDSSQDSVSSQILHLISFIWFSLYITIIGSKTRTLW